MLVCLILLCFCACGREKIETYRVAKADAEPAQAMPQASPAQSLAWSAPNEWRKEPTSGMRRASFRVGQGGDMSIVVFPGEAGGALANVNRWRGQLGLSSISEEDLARDSQKVRSRAGELLAVDFASSGRRMLGAILTSGGQTWFFKLTGPSATVAQAKPSFLDFLRSLRPQL